MVRLLLLAAFCTVLGFFPNQSKAATRPNVVIIVTDDMTENIGVKDGHLAEIAKRGIRFREARVPYALCTPTRVGIQTAKYPHNHGILGNNYPLGGFQAFRERGVGQSTLAVWLRGAGYYNGHVGKILNGYKIEDGPIAGYDELYASEDLTYFNYRMLHYVNGKGHVVFYDDSPESYATTVESRLAVDFIRRRNGAEAPFFLTIATKGVHSPSTCLPDMAATTSFEPYPRTPAFNAVAKNAPHFLHSLPPLSDGQINDIDRHHNERRCAMRGVDALVGDVISVLEETGMLGNTIVVGMSDQGFHQGDHRFFHGKDQLFDYDLLAPIVMMGPGIPVGYESDALILNIDVAETIRERAGVELPIIDGHPTIVDGRSLVPFLQGETPAAWRNMIYVTRRELESLVPGENPWPAEAHGLRVMKPNLLYTYYPETGDRELYFLDPTIDPYALTNVAGMYPDAVAVLHERMERMRASSGDAIRRLEEEPLILPGIVQQ